MVRDGTVDVEATAGVAAGTAPGCGVGATLPSHSALTLLWSTGAFLERIHM